jgi:hypothetical protein
MEEGVIIASFFFISIISLNSEAYNFIISKNDSLFLNDIDHPLLINKTTVKECYYCNGYCNETLPVINCENSIKSTQSVIPVPYAGEGFACVHIRLNIQALEGHLWREQPKVSADGFFVFRGCATHNVMFVKMCAQIDDQDGHSCLYCIEDLCNADLNGSTLIYTSPYVFIFESLLLLFNKI